MADGMSPWLFEELGHDPREVQGSGLEKLQLQAWKCKRCGESLIRYTNGTYDCSTGKVPCTGKKRRGRS